MRLKMRRSIIAKVDIEPGWVITEEMLSSKRPATGLPLSMKNEIIGRCTNRKIEADTVIYKNDIIF